MNHTELHATSNTSWLEATKQLIAAAQEKSKTLRSLTIKEDASGTDSEGKYRLRTRLRTI